MAIIRYTKDATIRYAYLNIFPDQFKTDKEKQDESWIKNTMDYFANKAYAEYVKNRDTFVKNYDLMKGILRMEDFYQEPQVRSFTDVQYEFKLAMTNRAVAGIETVFIMTSSEYGFTSSTLIREVASLGGDVSNLVPENVVKRLKDRFGQ